MKAAVITDIGKLEVKDVPIPTIGPYDALCRISYGATCAGTDIHIIDGVHICEPAFPTILGHESVGRVVEIGYKVKNIHIGDLITRVGAPQNVEAGIHSSYGGFAEYGVAKDHWEMRRDGLSSQEWNKNRVNRIVNIDIDEKVAPMIITWRETLSYIKRIGITSKSTVLIVGSGANALSMATHVYNTGADLTVVGSEKKKKGFERLSTVEYYDYKDVDIVNRITDDRKGRNFDYIIDAVGDSSFINNFLPILSINGRIGVYGWNDRKNYALNPFCSKGSFFVYTDGYDEEEVDEEVQDMILRGVLDASMWYDLENPTPLDRINEAYDSLRKHEGFKYLIELV